MKKMTFNLRVCIILLSISTLLVLPEKVKAQMLQQTETIDARVENFSSKLNNINVVRYTYTPVMAVASSDTASVESSWQDFSSYQKLGFLPDELENTAPGREQLVIGVCKDKHML